MVVTSRGRELGLGEAVSECTSVVAKAIPVTYTRVTVGSQFCQKSQQRDHHITCDSSESTRAFSAD